MRDIAIIILKVEQSATLRIYLVQYPQSLALEPGGDKEGPKKPNWSGKNGNIVHCQLEKWWLPKA